MHRLDSNRLFEVHPSRIDRLGVFALRPIRRGQHIVDYVGERLTAEAVEARYDEDAADDPHTFLFRISDHEYIDASVSGNDARFINHSCDPNCETEVEGDRVCIKAIKNIEPGVELTYDYMLDIDRDASLDRRGLFACRCGAVLCRGTMLDPGEDQ